MTSPDNKPLPIAGLDKAIETVSEDTLRTVFKSICATCPDAKLEATKQLLVIESQVQDKRDAPEDPNSATESNEKRLVPRYARCGNCKKEFDVSVNTSTSCQYHPVGPEPTGEELFVDNDFPEEVENHPEDWFDDFPHCFTYECCQGNMEDNPHGCKIDWHREAKQPSKKRKLGVLSSH